MTTPYAAQNFADLFVVSSRQRLAIRKVAKMQ